MSINQQEGGATIHLLPSAAGDIGGMGDPVSTEMNIGQHQMEAIAISINNIDVVEKNPNGARGHAAQLARSGMAVGAQAPKPVHPQRPLAQLLNETASNNNSAVDGEEGEDVFSIGVNIGRDRGS